MVSRVYGCPFGPISTFRPGSGRLVLFDLGQAEGVLDLIFSTGVLFSKFLLKIIFKKLSIFDVTWLLGGKGEI